MNFLSILILIFSPFLISLLILSPIFPNNEIKIRRFVKGFAFLHFIYCILFWVFFNPTNFGWSFQNELTFFKVSWLQPLGITATFGMDCISLVLVTLTSFLVLLAVIASKSMIKTKHRLYYSLILILQTAILGVFCAKDMFLFFLFWELELIPMYFLISQWGDKNAKNSAMKFLLYTFFGSIFMLLGMLLLYFYSFAINGVLTADIESLSITETVYPIWFQLCVFLAFLIGFAVKLPIVPLHTWLPNAHTDAATPVSMLLAGILLKMGAYGIIRFNLGLFPEIFKLLAPILIFLGAINIVYAGCIALVQTDLKRIVAYSSISHMGLVLIGLGVLNDIGFNGAMFQIVSHGLISAGLFMVVGVIYLRTKTRETSQLSGLGVIMPLCMYFALIIGLAALGLPLLSGFPAELMTFIGLLTSEIEPRLYVYGIFFLAAFGLILSAAYILYLFQRAFYGIPMSKFKSKIVLAINADIDVHDDDIYIKKGMTKSEIIVLMSLAVAILILGIYPNSLLDIFQVTTDMMMDFMKV